MGNTVVDGWAGQVGSTGQYSGISAGKVAVLKIAVFAPNDNLYAALTSLPSGRQLPPRGAEA